MSQFGIIEMALKCIVLSVSFSPTFKQPSDSLWRNLLVHVLTKRLSVQIHRGMVLASLIILLALNVKRNVFSLWKYQKTLTKNALHKKRNN